jgi:hypothetical protein
MQKKIKIILRRSKRKIRNSSRDPRSQRQKLRKMQKMMTRLHIKQKKLIIPIPAEVAEEIERQKVFIGF